MSTNTPASPFFFTRHHRGLWLGLLGLMALMVWWPALAVPAPPPGKAPCTVQMRAESELIRLHRESTLTGMALVTAQTDAGQPNTKPNAP
jgi:hypothetical protein